MLWRSDNIDQRLLIRLMARIRSVVSVPAHLAAVTWIEALQLAFTLTKCFYSGLEASDGCTAPD